MPSRDARILGESIRRNCGNWVTTAANPRPKIDAKAALKMLLALCATSATKFKGDYLAECADGR